jgi:hypothetical protein
MQQFFVHEMHLAYIFLVAAATFSGRITMLHCNAGVSIALHARSRDEADAQLVRLAEVVAQTAANSDDNSHSTCSFDQPRAL